MLMNNNASLQNNQLKLTETALEIMLETIGGARVTVSEDGKFVQIVKGRHFKTFRTQDLMAWVNDDTIVRKAMSFRDEVIASATHETATNPCVKSAVNAVGIEHYGVLAGDYVRGDLTDMFNHTWEYASQDARINCENQVAKLNNPTMNAAVQQARHVAAFGKESLSRDKNGFMTK